jgi:hypothetical protein
MFVLVITFSYFSLCVVKVNHFVKILNKTPYYRQNYIIMLLFTSHVLALHTLTL